MKAMQRVLRYDGLLPNAMTAKGKHRKATPKDIQAMKVFVDGKRKAKTVFDIIVEGTTPGDNPKKASAIVRKWAKAGATWWIEAMWGAPRNAKGLKAILKRIKQGPPPE